MDPEENKAVVRRQFECLNEGDVAGAAALWAIESFNHGRKVGRADLSKVYESLQSLQERHVLHEMIAEGDWVAVRTTCSGVYATTPKIPVNSGIFMGGTPTGRPYQVQHMHLFRVVNGELVEHWANRDDLGAATQVGLALKPAST